MAAKLVSMKITPAEMKKRQEPAETIGGGDRPAYPYGLSVRLDDDALEKLGIGEDLPEAESVMVLIAKVEVTSASSIDRAGGGKSRSVELQITDLCLEEGNPKDAAKALYKES